MAGQEQRRRRVVLFALPFQGHLSPMLQLAALLHERGLAITVLHTVFNAPDPARRLELAFVPIHETFPDEVTSPAGAGADIVTQLLALNAATEAPFRAAPCAAAARRGRRRRLRGGGRAVLRGGARGRRARRPRARAPDGQRRHVPQHARVPAAARLRLRSHQRRAAGRAGAGARAAPRAGPDPRRRQRHGRALRLHRPRRRRGPVIGVRRGRQHVRGDRGVGAGQDPARALPSGIRGRAPAQAVAGAGGAVPARAGPRVPGVAGRAPAALRAVRQPGQRGLRRPLRVRGDSGVPFLWVIRPGSVHGVTEEVFPPFPDEINEEIGIRGKIVTWAPQREVLAHRAIGAFWTHCGWNSTLESVYEGVPMIAQACFADQMVNARYVTHQWGVGLEVGELIERESVAMAVRKMMAGEDGAQMRERAHLQKVQASAATGLAMDSLVEFISSLRPVNMSIT